MKIFKLIAVISAVAVAAIVAARGDGQASDAKNALATSGASLKEPVKSVLDRYLKIHDALADDSMDGISANAALISKTVKADEAKTLPSEVAREADALAGAKDLATARESFKVLSQALIKYLSDKNVQTGKFNEAFCPMANAYWLQTNKDISNPYLGHRMPDCGEIKRGF